MNTKNTWTWLVVAAILFASIFLLDRYFRPPVVSAQNVLPDLQPSAVTSVQVIPAGALEIRADRTNDFWLLASPAAYPAQSAAIDTLLSALQKLTVAFPISASELRQDGTNKMDFGLDSPPVKIVLVAGDQRWELSIGNKTAPGDQVYLRVVGVDGVFVTDAAWLKFIPRSANDWRSTALVAASENNFDSIMLTNNTKGIVIELHQDATNHLWRMTRPLQARADGDRITDALQQLQAAQVAQFITNDAKVDLTAFGLQPDDLDLRLNHGTNFISALRTGKSPASDPTQIYAQRDGWNMVFTTAKDPLSPWHGTVNDFRDPHLLELTAPVAEIEVQGADGFTLQRQGTNDWKIAGEKFSADAETVQVFLKVLAELRVAEFVNDVATPTDLANYGFTNAARQIILRSAIGDSNAVIAQLAFAAQTNGIFVHRADEDLDKYFIYSIAPEDAKILFGNSSLFESGWQFRDRRLWNFSETNVAQITLRQNGRTRQLVRNGVNKWSFAAGSQGILDPREIEDTARRFGEMSVTGWVAHNVNEPEKFGLNTNNLEITFDLKTGEKLSVDFGTELPAAHTALAAVTLDGGRWVFVFSPTLYQFVQAFLTIPADGR
jgi:Domain of unknown function (DUF4340)